MEAEKVNCEEPNVGEARRRTHVRAGGDQQREEIYGGSRATAWTLKSVAAQRRARSGRFERFGRLTPAEGKATLFTQFTATLLLSSAVALLPVLISSRRRSPPLLQLLLTALISRL